MYLLKCRILRDKYPNKSRERKDLNKKRQIKNLTATTTYPCFGQDLGDSVGAGSSDLPVQK